jgi:hypothetical protein
LPISENNDPFGLPVIAEKSISFLILESAAMNAQLVQRRRTGPRPAGASDMIPAVNAFMTGHTRPSTGKILFSEVYARFVESCDSDLRYLSKFKFSRAVRTRFDINKKTSNRLYVVGIAWRADGPA